MSSLVFPGLWLLSLSLFDIFAKRGLLFLIKQWLLFTLHISQLLQLLIYHLNTYCIQEFPVFFQQVQHLRCCLSCQESNFR